MGDKHDAYNWRQSGYRSTPRLKSDLIRDVRSWSASRSDRHMDLAHDLRSALEEIGKPPQGLADDVDVDDIRLNPVDRTDDWYITRGWSIDHTKADHSEECFKDYCDERDIPLPPGLSQALLEEKKARKQFLASAEFWANKKNNVLYLVQDSEDKKEDVWLPPGTQVVSHRVRYDGSCGCNFTAVPKFSKPCLIIMCETCLEDLCPKCRCCHFRCDRWKDYQSYWSKRNEQIRGNVVEFEEDPRSYGKATSSGEQIRR
jgi:hypothetical protein